MGLVLDNAVTAGLLQGGDRDILKADLHAMADRIAHNREIAGFHYHTDTKHGQKLAKDMFDLIMPNLATLTRLQSAISAAQAEWSAA